MKIGVAGMLGSGSPEEARRVREMGFGAASWHLDSLELARDRAALLRVREALEGDEIELCQLLPPQYPGLVHPEPQMREAGVAALEGVLEAAATLGAGNVYVRPGSLNDRGPWTPHPDNHRPETRARLVESLRRLAPRAESLGIPLALEGHVVSPVDTPAVLREILDQVASPWLQVNLDPVNFIRTLDEAYDSTALINELFDLLAGSIATAHVKDVTVDDRLVVHIDETVPGQGYLDQETFLRRFDECCPHGVMLIEHLPADRVPEARRALLEFAARAGIRFGEG